jgi:hypothetical protein
LRTDEFLSELRKQRHRNFVRIVEMLALLKTSSFKGSINNLKEELSGSKEISYRKWLIKKIKELEQ